MRDLSVVLHNLEKSLGKKVIKKGSEILPVKVFPSGIPMLDYHWGGGPRMRAFNVIAGKPQSGKTSIAMQICGRAQSLDFPILWVDLERQFDPERSRTFGMKPEEILLMESDKENELTAEQLRRQIVTFLRAFNKMKDNRLIIVLDSLAANTSEKEMEEDAQKLMGGDARINNQSIKSWNLLLDHNQMFILINEFRDDIGPYGSPDKLPGGWAQYYFASTIIHTRQGKADEIIKDDEGNIIGETFKWTVKKSRNAPPRETGGIPFLYETGFDIPTSLIQTGLKLGIFERAGAWFTLPNGERVQGEKKFIELLKNNKPLLIDLQTELYSKMPRQRYEYVEEPDELP